MTKREGREEPRTKRQPEQPEQPEQASNRRAMHEHEAKVRKGYEEAEHPERQGDGDPGTESEQAPQD
jgi:hypothetical protein